jgi:hypothetical protein
VGQNGSIGADGGSCDAEVLDDDRPFIVLAETKWQAENSGCVGAVWRLRSPEEIRQDYQVQLLRIVHDQRPGSVVGDGMLVDGTPAHTPAAA